MTDAELLFKMLVGLGVALSLLGSWRALRRDVTKDLVAAILVDDKWEKAVEKLMKQAQDTGETAASDRLQVLINQKLFMPREVQDLTNREIFRRLAALEQQIGNIPDETAEKVMLALRSRDRV